MEEENVTTAELEQTTRALYDDYRALDAYFVSKAWWDSGTLPPDLSLEGIVLGARIASRMGSSILCYRLQLLAWEQDPAHPLVRLYVQDRVERHTSAYTLLKQYDASTGPSHRN